MGTVPDPLRARKGSLDAASGKEEAQGALQAASPQPQLAQLSKNNPGTGTSSVEATPRPGPAAEALIQAGDDETSRPDMSSPGVLNEVEQVPPTHSAPGDPQPPGNKEPAASALNPTAGKNLKYVPFVMPANQSDLGNQSNVSACSARGDSSVKPQKTSSSPQRGESGCPVGNSQGSNTDPAFRDFPSQEGTPGVVQTPDAAASGFSSADGLGAGRQQGFCKAAGRPCEPATREGGCSEKEPPSASYSEGKISETPQHLQSEGPGCPSDTENGPPPAPNQMSRFKEASTMTNQTEGGTKAASGRAQQDAGVQAVVCVESRSVATSPSILAAFLKESPASQCLEQEQLRVVCHNGGSHVLELSSTELDPPESGRCPDLVPQVRIQTAAPTSTFHGECKLGRSPGEVLKSSHSHGISHHDQDAQATGSSAGATPAREEPTSEQLAGTNSGSQKASLLGQISLSVDSQTEINPGVGKSEPKPLEVARKTIYNHKTEPECKPSNSCSYADTDYQLESLDSTAGERMKERKPVSPQIAREQKPAAGQTLDVKTPLLNPKSQENGVTGPGASPAPSPGRKNQEGQEDNRQAKTAANLSLPSDGLGDSSPGSSKTPSRSVKASPRRASRVSEFLKELNVTAQVGLTTGEKKKQPSAALKPSKRVRDVVWDAQGMTWEVYGASLDPESLGIAIQNHLQRQIKEHEKLVSTPGSQPRRSVSSDTSSSKKLKGRQHRVFHSMLQNLRRPNCCVRPAPSSVLD